MKDQQSNLRSRLRPARALFVLALFLAIWGPLPAFAHENLGDDELAVANWMLIAAFVVAVMGAVALLWAARSGQFSNIEESKYRMLETADEYDALVGAAPPPSEAAAAPREETRKPSGAPSAATTAPGARG
jgi:cbb3-type cytochrome oxidase maturation protein